jgi:hypothetical protein
MRAYESYSDRGCWIYKRVLSFVNILFVSFLFMQPYSVTVSWHHGRILCGGVKRKYLSMSLGLVIWVSFGFYGVPLYECMSHTRTGVIGYIKGFCLSLMFCFSLFSLCNLLRSPCSLKLSIQTLPLNNFKNFILA